jgi:hypothetical protein
MSVGKASIRRALGTAAVEPAQDNRMAEVTVTETKTTSKPAAKKPATKKATKKTAPVKSAEKKPVAKVAPKTVVTAPKIENAETVISVGDALPYYLL